jgi:hypothetical protein
MRLGVGGNATRRTGSIYAPVNNPGNNSNNILGGGNVVVSAMFHAAARPVGGHTIGVVGVQSSSTGAASGAVAAAAEMQHATQAQV